MLTNLGNNVPPQSRLYNEIQRTRREICSMYFQPRQRGTSRADVFKTLTDVFAKKQEEQKKLIDDLVREMVRADDADLIMRLSDEQPLVRWVAVQVIGRKRLHAEASLISLLDDAQAEVRQAARQALVRLSRGTDFGPAPNAQPGQRRQSMQSWRNWWALQDSPSRA